MSSLLSNVRENASLFNISMQIGIGASSFLTCSQLGVGMFGIMPLILSEKERTKINLQQTQQIAKSWNFFFTKATKPVVGSVLVSSLAFLVAAFNVPTVSDKINSVTKSSIFSSSSSIPIVDNTSQNLKNFLFFTAFFAILPLPFTAIRLLPNIQTLQKLLAKDTSAWTKSEESLALKNVQLWNSGHKIRVVLYTLTTVLGVFAYNATPNV